MRMKETMKAIRFDIYISAIMSLIMGILFMVFPVESGSVISVIVGIIVLIFAIFMLIGAIANRMGLSVPAIILAILLGAIGIWIIVNPLKFAVIVYIAVGVMLAVHGIQSIVSAFTVKSMGVKTWWLMLIVGIFSVVFGFYCIFCSFGAFTAVSIVVGVMLILDAITTIIVAIRASKYKKNMYGDREVESKVIK